MCMSFPSSYFTKAINLKIGIYKITRKLVYKYPRIKHETTMTYLAYILTLGKNGNAMYELVRSLLFVVDTTNMQFESGIPVTGSNLQEPPSLTSLKGCMFD